jgi:acetyl esterase/lipase
MAFIANANTKITKEIPENVRLKCTTDRIAREPEQIAEALFASVREIDEESHKYPCLTHALQTLSHMLETERLSFKSIVRFSERVEVKNLLHRLQTDFADELAQEQLPSR